jgi:hypothetical protein
MRSEHDNWAALIRQVLAPQRLPAETCCLRW